jgi:hypothetical protein
MATVKSGIGTSENPGFSDSDTITSTTLNNHVNDATVTNILTADIADSSSKTTGVTFAKMQHISTEKLVGRTSSNEGDIEEVDIAGASGILLDEDTMSSDSDTRGATQQSIKAFAESLIPKYINISSNSSLDIAQTDTSTTTHTYPIADFAGGAGLDTAKIRGFFVEITAKARYLGSTTTADVKVTMPDGTDVVLLGHQAQSPEDNSQQVRGTVFAPVNSGQTNFVLKPTLSGNTKSTSLTIRGCLQYG